jgi:hypothetical protein
MRKLSILLLAVSFVFACNNKKAGETTIVSDDGKTKTTIDVNPDGTVGQMDEMTKKTEELKKLTPLTLDQLKALLPDELMGIKRSNFNANSSMGFAVADATYKGEEDKELKLTIWDCAGEAGAGFYTLTYWSQFNMQSENDDGYTKSVSFNGGKAIESYRKGQNQYNLMYTSGDRLLVSLEGENVGLDDVKQAAQSLNLKTN